MGLKLTKIGFDNLENRDGEVVEFEKIFVDGNGLTAHGNAEKWLCVQPAEKHYLGWDGQVYPRYKLEPCYINNGE